MDPSTSGDGGPSRPHNFYPRFVPYPMIWQSVFEFTRLWMNFNKSPTEQSGMCVYKVIEIRWIIRIKPSTAAE